MQERPANQTHSHVTGAHDPFALPAIAVHVPAHGRTAHEDHDSNRATETRGHASLTQRLASTYARRFRTHARGAGQSGDQQARRMQANVNEAGPRTLSW